MPMATGLLPRLGHAARRGVLADLRCLEKRAAELAGLVRVVVRDDSAEIWDIEFCFDTETALGADLAEHERRTGCPAHLLLELHFPALYPAEPPALHLIRPRLREPLSDAHGTGCSGWVGVSSPTADRSATTCIPLTFGGELRLERLSVNGWSSGSAGFPDLTSLLLDVRDQLLRQGARLDTDSVRPYHAPCPNLCLGATTGIPTVASCSVRHPAGCLEYAAGIFSELAGVPPGRVVLPQEYANMVYSRVFGGSGGGAASAVHVEVKNLATGGRLYAGLADTFAQQDSAIFMPNWMLRQLFLRPGDEVRVRVVNLPLCGFVRLQPHTQDFYDAVGEHPQAALQTALAPMPALTAGLSVPVELPGGAAGIVARRMRIFVARLEDADGNEVLAAKLPAHAGVFGMHELRVDFLPAADLDESGAEYRQRAEEYKLHAGRVSKLALEQCERWRAKRQAEAEAAMLRPTEADLVRLGDGTTGLDLCFRLPNGRQLRRRFPPELPVKDLKLFVLSLRCDEVAPWQPQAATTAENLDLVAYAPPRHRLEDSEVVATIGDRAVVLVTEHSNSSVDEHTGNTGADAVLYPATLGPELGDHVGSRCSSSGGRSSRAISARMLPNNDGELALGLGSGGAAAALPEAELRELALAMGISSARVHQASDKTALEQLLNQHVLGQSLPELQSQPVGNGNLSGRTSSASSTTASAHSRHVHTPSSVVSEGSERPCPVTAAQLAPLGLTIDQFLQLPGDTREAIVVAAGAASHSSSHAARRASRARSGIHDSGGHSSARRSFTSSPQPPRRSDTRTPSPLTMPQVGAVAENSGNFTTAATSALPTSTNSRRSVRVNSRALAGPSRALSTPPVPHDQRAPGPSPPLSPQHVVSSSGGVSVSPQVSPSQVRAAGARRPPLGPRRTATVPQMPVPAVSRAASSQLQSAGQMIVRGEGSSDVGSIPSSTAVPAATRGRAKCTSAISGSGPGSQVGDMLVNGRGPRGRSAVVGAEGRTSASSMDRRQSPSKGRRATSPLATRRGGPSRLRHGQK